MSFTSWETYTKLMSQEDLNLQYDNSATTAYFDLENRTVVVPTFKFITEEITQLLISHEVAHAKYSKYSFEDYEKYTKKYGALFNIVEDAFIERKIQKEFPGLKEIFIDGYAQLVDNNFFGIDKPLKSYNLCERLNLYSKCSNEYDIPFSGKENEFAYRIKALNSNDEVVSLCEDIIQYLKSQFEKNKNSNTNKSENHHSDDSNASNDPIKFNKQDEDSNDARGSSEGVNDNSNNNEPNTTKESNESDDSDDSNETSNNGFDKNEENNSNDSENSNSCNSNEENDESDDAFKSQIEDSITKSFKENLNDYGESQVTNSTDKMNSYYTKDYNVLNFKYLEKEGCNYYYQNNSKEKKNTVTLVKNLAKSATTIFQQKKSARELANTKNRSTGKLNMKKIQKYQISENIFRQVKSVSEGKNHAVIIMIDYSGSMNQTKKLRDTIIQATILSEFCYTNNIPFEVVLFGSVLHTPEEDKRTPVKICDNLHYKTEYLLSFGFGFSGISSCKDGNYYYLRMGETPTFYSLLALYHNLKKFKENGIEKTSIFIITDGVHSYDHDVSTMSINNIIYTVKDFIDDEPVHHNWAIELACLFLKENFDCYISISYIGFTFEYIMETSGTITQRKFFRNLYGGYISELKNTVRFIDECMYIFKHQFYFQNKEPLKLTNNLKYLSYAFDENPFIDQAQIIFLDAFNSNGNEKQLTQKMKLYTIYSLFVNNFVDEIA